MFEDTDARQRLDSLNMMAQKMEREEFTSFASLSAYLFFFTSAFNYGLISVESYAKLLEQLFASLSSGPSITRDYIFIVELRGLKRSRYKWDIFYMIDKLRNVLAMYLKTIAKDPINFRSSLLHLSFINPGSGQPADIDLRLPRIFSHKKFVNFFMSFLLCYLFNDEPSIDSRLTIVSLQIIVENFLILAAKRANAFKRCIRARKYLDSIIMVLDDVDLAKRLSDVLWSVVPLDSR